MKKYCFSDIYFFRKLENCIFTKKIYKRHIAFNNRIDFKIEKLYYKKDIFPDECYVSHSNYLLQYDCLQLLKKNRNIQIFNEKRKPYQFDSKKIKEISIKEKSYLLRSFLSSVNYESLQNIGLERIEHFLIILYSNFLNYYEYNGLLFPKKKDYSIRIQNQINPKEHFLIQSVNNNTFFTLSFILYIANLKRVNPFWVMDILYKEFFYKLNITDPFIGKFEILNLDNFFFKDEILQIKQVIKNISVLFRATDESNKNYFCVDLFGPLQEEKNLLILKKYFHFFVLNNSYLKSYTSNSVIKITHKNLNKSNIYALYYLFFYNSFFIPIEDFFISLFNLLKMGYLVFLPDGRIFPEKKIKKYCFFDYNNYYLSLENILEKFKDFSFAEELFELPFFPLIKTEKLSFRCPICNNREYILDYDFLKCKDKNCNFLFNRKNLHSLGIKQVLLKDIIKSLSLPSIYIEDVNKNKRLFVLKEYTPFRYSLTLKSFKNSLKN